MKQKFICSTLLFAAFCAAAFLDGSGCSSKKPTASDNACLDENGDPLPVAPESERVDLYSPIFSNSTDVTNTLFPVTIQHSYVMLGLSDGAPFRTEVTLLPTTRNITINGVTVQALESQYCAFLDERIHEVAIDWYAQDDSGAVWYLGEAVFNYEDGVVADSDGTWLAGNEGPAAMIMPASPKVGDVYRPENACGVVFEEVTVKSIGVTVNGPHGQVTGAILVEELHMDGTREDKTFAPGYGEFSTGSGNNLEAMALAIPTDTLSGSTPTELEAITTATSQIFDAADSANWSTAAADLTNINNSWTAYQSEQIPPRLSTQMNDALAALTAAINSQDSEGTRQGAIDLARASWDFRLRYQSSTDIDIARFELWARQVLVDAEGNDPAAVKGDATTLEWTRDRFIHVLDGTTVGQINTNLATLRTAANAGNLQAATDAAQQLRDIIDGLN